MLVDAWMRRRVRIEVTGRIANPREMFSGVSAQYGRVVRRPRFPPFPIAMPALQEWNRARDSFWPLRVPWRRVLDATWIVKNNHGKLLCSTQEHVEDLQEASPLSQGKSGVRVA